MNHPPGADETRGPPRDALLILAGVAANRQKKFRLIHEMQDRGGFDVHLPNLPFRLGLRACALWLRHIIRTRFIPRGYSCIHVLNFIGGSFVFRMAAPALPEVPFGRIVYVRSPLQEQVPRRSVEKWSKPLVWLVAGKAVADMASQDINALPYPPSALQQGVLVERCPSALAIKLGLTRQSLPAAAWNHETMSPGTAEVLDVAVSHDDVYTDPQVLDQVHAFMMTGHFRREAIASAAGH